ncbi:DNA-binding transcriptional regulator, LysR family [Terribacillus halophilus]|uniref:DNA-binding transcriptional regulator, LysR family n=1 Tax=Terribacillus halophilus TaxID=361279 RepID=A0A1G6TVJ4_9BACI|nr:MULTISPECIES: LysR family transcriptional regulator [Terribacillus]PAD39740.1 LysR family transcriptional regulator [Terribacillus sp. 7520-G]SDD33061.1 DNA-binding transcriptional regulator, LysR family [Terribacillus halophilus]
MHINHLKTFTVAADTLNFTKTAQRLDYAQSSVTAQIKALEKAYGVELFQRLGKRIYLTEAGIKMQSYAERILALHDEMSREFDEGMEEKGTILIGACESQCIYRLPKLLRFIRSRYPQVQVVLKPVPSSKTSEQMLQKGELDLAFIMDRDQQYDFLESVSLFQEDIVLIGSANHPLSVQSSAALSEVMQHPLILTEKGCSYRTELEQVLEEQNLHLENIIEFGSIEAIKQCVKAGLGFSYLPLMTVRNELESGELSSIRIDAPINQPITKLLWHKDKRMTKVVQDVIDFSIKHIG